MTADPRVLRLITRLNIGGPAIQALLLTRELQDRYPTVLATGRAPEHEGELSDPEVDVTYVPLVRAISPPKDLSAYRAVSRLMREHRPRILHTHMAKAGTIGRLAARRDHSIKTVHTFHGHVLEGYFSPQIEKAFMRMERYLARRTDALIAVSEEVRDSLLDLGIGTSDRFHVIPLGFKLDQFLDIEGSRGGFRKELGLALDTPLVAVLGRVTAIKDHATLIRAIAELPDVNLAILGDGDLRSQTEALVLTLGIKDRTHFVGWRTDVAAALADVDVVALTSRNEGTPVSLIEASAAGCPVVATDVGGVRSVVEDGVTGFVVPPGDPAAVAAALDRLLSDQTTTERFGRAGREKVRERFSHLRLIDDITALYDDLVHRPRLGRS